MEKERKIILFLIILFFVWVTIVIYWFNNNSQKNKISEVKNKKILVGNKKDLSVDEYYGVTTVDNINNEKKNIKINTYNTVKENKVKIINQKKVKIICTSYINSYIRPGGPNIPEDVAKLEEFLSEYYNKNKNSVIKNSRYDVSEIDLIKEFQRNEGLVADGYIGNETRKKINIAKCTLDWTKNNIK